MQTFATSRDAKEFLVSRVVTEAQREGVLLSEVERKMLYFSETAWTLPDITEVNEAFDREYDQKEYEQKIGILSRNFLADAKKNDQSDFDAWKAAVRTLQPEDHYILVLIAAENGSSNTSKFSFRTLLVVGAIAGCLALVVLYLFLRR